MDISRNSLTMGKALKRQITKYLNECRTRDSSLNSVKASLKMTIRKPDPPPVPVPDYKGSDAEDSPYDEGWNTDFDDETDDEDDGIPLTESSHTENSTPCQVNSISSKEMATSETQTTNALSEFQPALQKNSATCGRKAPLPRPPPLDITAGRTGTVSPNAASRPDVQPPLLPSITTELLQSDKIFDEVLTRNGLLHDEYEVPSSSVSEAGSASGSTEFQTPTIKTSISLSGGSMFSTDRSPQSPHEYDYGTAPDDEYELPKENSLSPDVLEKPALPPKNVSPPPLPEKPKPKLKDKPLLPRKASDDPTSKSKKKQLNEYKQAMKCLFNFNSKTSIEKKANGIFTSFTKAPTIDIDDSKSLNGKITKSVSLGSLQQAVKDSSGIGGCRPLPPVPSPKTKAGSSSRASLGASSFQLPPLQLAPPPHPLALHAWFHQVEREQAESLLKKLGKTGAYLVRESKRAGESNPFTLTILYDGKISHLNIRQKIDNTFALGREKENEKTFSSVEELINYHQAEPIVLTSKGLHIGKTILCCHP